MAVIHPNPASVIFDIDDLGHEQQFLGVAYTKLVLVFFVTMAGSAKQSRIDDCRAIELAVLPVVVKNREDLRQRDAGDKDDAGPIMDKPVRYGLHPA
jgi:hypothetical protein